MRNAVVIVAGLCLFAFAAPAMAEKIEYLGGPRPGGAPLSEAVRVGDTLYLSGKLGIKPGTRELVPGGIKAQTKQTMENIEAALEKHGYTMDHVVKCTVMLADIDEWAAFNEVYKTFFDEHFPARSAFATGGLALGARAEVECLAAR